MPTAVSYDQVKGAYDKARKAMPELTPAAWRKAAAQDLGMPYDAYLAIWKTKGKVPVVPVSTATHPVSAVGGQVAKKVTPPSVTPQALGKLLENMGIQKHSYSKPKYTHTGQMYGGGSTLKPGHMITKSSTGDGYYIKFPGIHGAKVVDAADDLKAAGYDVTMLGGNGVKISLPKQIPSATESLKYADDLKDEVDGLFESWKFGLISEDELYDAVDLLGEAVTMGKQFPGVPSTYMNKLVSKLINDVNDIQVKKPAPAAKTAYAQKVAVKKAAVKKVPASPPPFVITSAPSVGGLTYDAAQAAYKLMKQQMPGGTPAQWRHAAAKHLGMDYNDYLKAWKNKPGGVSKPATPKMGAPSTTAPTSTTAASGPNVIPLHPSSVGKYSNSTNLTEDQIKTELARLFGPTAKKEYISPSFDDVDGMYTVDFPQSILTKQGMDDVVAGLQKLGLKVEKSNTLAGNRYRIGPVKYKAPPPGARVIKDPHSGKPILNRKEVQKESDTWHGKLDSDTKDAWRSYTGGGYSDINSALRGRNGATVTPSIRKMSDNLSSSMETTTEVFNVVRGGTYDVDQFKKGTLWKDKGFFSTSADLSGGFGGNVRFEVTVVKGSRGRYIGSKSSHPGEREYLMDKGTSFRVTEVVTLGNGHIIVRVTSIPQKIAKKGDA